MDALSEPLLLRDGAAGLPWLRPPRLDDTPLIAMLESHSRPFETLIHAPDV
jgi:hypothetical protein